MSIFEKTTRGKYSSLVTENLTEKLKTLPSKPGIYRYKNARGEVLYVGKAKNLRTRVKSYFRAKADLEPAKEQMVTEIADLETIVVDSENEALILEANLIRQHQPPYNVVLRDDKYYLFIKITKEELPRVFPVRRIGKDGARYFGPYSSARSVRQTLKLLRRIFPHRGEKESPREKIFPHPLFEEGEETYEHNIQSIIRFLKGERDEIIKRLRDGMRQASQEKKYEQAAIWRDQLQALERLEGNQKVFLPQKESFDVVSIATDSGKSAANVFQVRQGKLLGKQTFLLQSRGTTRSADILRQFILQYYRDAQDKPKLILIPEQLPDQETIATYISTEAPVTFAVPERGKKKQLLDMGQLNAQQLLTEEQASFAQDARLTRASQELAEALGLGSEPLGRVETYDISNIQGTLATGSMVVFTNGQPDKDQYRKFKIKIDPTSLKLRGASGQPIPNDYAMLQQIIRRRFSEKNKEWPTPDLVLIDGGKGQLSSVKKVLDELEVDVNLASIAKREEELFVPGEKESIRLPYDSDALYLVQRMRDEAHRFTISYHRLLRSKKHSRSLLDEVPGIGPKLKKKLLAKFGSLKNIRATSDEELANVLGAAKTKTLRDYL